MSGHVGHPVPCFMCDGRGHHRDMMGTNRKCLTCNGAGHKWCAVCGDSGHNDAFRTGAVCPHPVQAHPMADAQDLLEARCAELERENRTAHAEGFLAGRLEAAEMVRERSLAFVGTDVGLILTALAGAIRGDT